MTDSKWIWFESHWPSLVMAALVALFLTAWTMDMVSAWQDLKAKGSVPAPIVQPKPLPLPQPLPEREDKDTDTDTGAECVIIDGVSICDQPVSFKPICALHGDHAHPNFGYAHKVRYARPEAQKALKWMTDEVGISDNFELLSAEFSKKTIGFATIRGQQRYIVLDQEETFLAPNGQVYWDSLGILAHELGHHLAAHTSINNQDNHTRELEADRFAGQMLGKLGASQAQAVRWTRQLNAQNTDTHPARHRRLQAARDGWLQSQTTKAQAN